MVGANNIDGNDIGPFSVAGAPFDCSALAASPPSAAGAALVSAFVQLDRPTVGDVVFTTALVVPGTPRPPEVVPLVGDCNGSDEVTVDEIIAMVNVALGNSVADVCRSGDGNGNGQISVDEIVTAEQRAERV